MVRGSTTVRMAAGTRAACAFAAVVALCALASASALAPVRIGGRAFSPTMARVQFQRWESARRAQLEKDIVVTDLDSERTEVCLRIRGGSSGTGMETNLGISFKDKSAFDAAQGAVHTKFICTVGPKTQSVEMISKLIDAGMNVARMNFSHGDHKYHAQTIENVREALRQSKRMCAIALDTKGPEIRTGKIASGNDIELVAGQEFTLVNDFGLLGDSKTIGQSYPKLSEVIDIGSEVLIDDGLISMTVVCKTADSVTCKVANNGLLGQNKGINLPGAAVDLPALTERDKVDLAFGCEQGVDFIFASFIRQGEQVKEIRRHLESCGGGHIRIISKIENQEGLQNFDEILAESDGIMVARGDMGVEIPVEKVAIAQKMIISKCNVAGKPVVTATQMLESMIVNPRPTRAETTDVANAVFDGSDCVMLSGETAKGKYPIQAIETMVRICREAEKVVDYTPSFIAMRRHTDASISMSVDEAIASSAVKTAFDLRARLILCLTMSGRTARLICKYRPVAPILCATADEQTARHCMVLRGCYPMVMGSLVGLASVISRCIATAKLNGLVHAGDVVVVVSGVREVTGATNDLRVLRVE